MRTRGLGVGLGALLGLVLVLAAGHAAAAGDAPLPDVRGFDHPAHAAALARAGKPVDCTTCHPTGPGGRLKSTPDSKHRPCANSGCHAPWPIPPSRDDLVKFCIVCHARSDVDRGRLKPFYPPHTVAPDHAAGFPHARHAALGGSTRILCSQCHANHGEGKVRRGKDTHETCAGCHEADAAPRMNDCAGCHKPIAQVPPLRGPSPPSAWRTTKTFSHEAHGRAAGDAARACNTCHGNLGAVPAGAALPRPPMQQCAGCHDGKTRGPSGRAIFAATGTTCTRCHQLPDGFAAPPMLPLSPARFSHAGHAGAGVRVGECASCHALDARTFVAAPAGVGLDHQPCATCHQPDFFARSPRICGACHDDVRPWLVPKLVNPATASEFGHDFSHRAHVKDLGAKDNGFCQRCHSGRFEAEGPASRSHATCAPCHAADAAPRMTECASCHRLGQSLGTLAPRDPSFPWYVRPQFRHATHGQDPRTGQPTSCLLCHDQVVSANRLAELGRPRMAQCDACHDGKLAFKTTGFGCARCHGGGTR